MVDIIDLLQVIGRIYRPVGTSTDPLPFVCTGEHI